MTARIAILASGSGTTAEAFIRHSLDEQLDQTVVLVVVSRHQAGIIERINDLNQELGLSIECLAINGQTHPPAIDEVVQKGDQSNAEQQAILDTLTAANIDIVALLGYMKRVGPKIIKAYGWQPFYSSKYQARMVNSHPGPLPQTRALYGEGVQQHILDIGLDHGAQTLHLVAADYDDGPIVAEHIVPVEPGDTSATLFARIQAVEKEYIAGDIASFWQECQSYQKTKQEAQI